MPVSERFERGVSLAASLLAHFAEEQAEIRLVVDGKREMFGIGRQQLHQSLKNLALIEPHFHKEPRFSFDALDEIFTETENSYTFFVTARNEADFLDALVQKAKIINY